jgi:hypothetical protein
VSIQKFAAKTALFGNNFNCLSTKGAEFGVIRHKIAPDFVFNPAGFTRKSDRINHG